MADLTFVVVQAEQKAREVAALLAPRHAHHDGVGGLALLHLEDGLARARHVGEAEPLGDDSVEPGDVEPVEPLLRLLRVAARG